MINTPLVTWLDVLRILKKETKNLSVLPSYIKHFECYGSGVDIITSNAEFAINWLGNIFSHAFNKDSMCIEFDMGSYQYPVDIIIGDGSYSAINSGHSLWQDNEYINDTYDRYPQPLNGMPSIIAFHSFKGGVGRTTSLMTYAAAYLDELKEANGTGKVLLIDGDIEAPGITYWIDDSQKPTVSFIKYIEAVQFSPVSEDETVKYFANQLRRKSINIDGSLKEIFVLPSSLSSSDIFDISVTPVNIARGHQNPWELTDSIAKLGKALGVDAVFVDLRAGFSELSSTLLLDPRVERFFVTTVAPQSTIGLSEVLRAVHKFQKNLDVSVYKLYKPTVILSMLTEQLKKLPNYDRSIELIEDAFPSAPDGDQVTSGVEWCEVSFDASLMSLNDVKNVFQTITQHSSLYSVSRVWAREKISTSSSALKAKAEFTLAIKKDQARLLNKCCEKFQYAETGDADDMLVTEPIRNLAKEFSFELPNAVSIGSKGAGKTFSFVQFCKEKTWGSILNKVGQYHELPVDGMIYPIMSSKNLNPMQVSSAKGNATTTLNIKSEVKLTDLIIDGLSQGVKNWYSFWESSIPKVFDETLESFNDLNDWLLERNQAVVLVVDGLEDYFHSLTSSQVHRDAILALLEVPNKLRELNNRRLGLIIFARIDYVQTAITQNYGQFIGRYGAFKLEWTPETFLRLCYWIFIKAGIIKQDVSSAQTMSTDVIFSSLEKIWGKKLGRVNSKEAFSARWIFAALCDLNGKLQARDVVRFLKYASEIELNAGNDTWTDRLLSPDAVRGALPKCSTEKVEEAVLELPLFKGWVQRLNTIEYEKKIIPFNYNDVGLTLEEIDLFKDLGIIYEDVDRKNDDKRFYIPEVFRYGLNFRTISGKPRVHALLKKNMPFMPF